MGVMTCMAWPLGLELLEVLLVDFDDKEDDNFVLVLISFVFELVDFFGQSSVACFLPQ